MFHGAILQSGCEMEYWATLGPDMQPENFVAEVAAQFECPTEPSEVMVDCLRNVDAYDLMMASFTCPVGIFVNYTVCDVFRF